MNKEQIIKELGDRITPELITSLDENEVFVFGSNLGGAHFGGAAFTAYKKFGAVWGQASGMSGKTYAIPTVSKALECPLPIDEIKPYVEEFVEFAKNNKHLKFYVTPVGCGIAGIPVSDMATLFFKAGAELWGNILLPLSFLEYQLNKFKDK